jgi:NADH-quinone oxidoreductase subunit G
MSEVKPPPVPPKEKVKFLWNDKEIEAKPGSNLLKAALDNKIDVAHYCYHPGLSIAGVCRMCMVEQEGVPRPFPACNATVSEGIKVRNDSAQIKAAVEWTLQLHLVNHPLDCPICDQAGECGLQDYYMKHGVYDSSMIDKKVHKDKVQDIGRDVMLDAERCILCSRCVRFTDEVTVTHEMGIVNRGDHAEITANESLKNYYAQNMVDICPVGALTSKDFRFKQRVWFLDDVDTTCIGCETGCSVKVSFNKNDAYRVKPRFDEAVNGYWMCDDGRKIYEHVGRADRLVSFMENRNGLFLPAIETEVMEKFKKLKKNFILSTDLTNEEYAKFFETVKGQKVNVALYRLPEHKLEDGRDFDGLLRRSSKNANLKGAEAAFKKAGFDPSEEALHNLISHLQSSDVVFSVMPEIVYNQDHLETLVKKLSKAGLKVALTSNEAFYFMKDFDFLLPLPTFLEKQGTIVNFKGMERVLNRAKNNWGETSKTIFSYAELMFGE